MPDDMTKATAERIGVPWEQYVQERAAAIPARRAGHVDDIADTVSSTSAHGLQRWNAPSPKREASLP